MTYTLPLPSHDLNLSIASRNSILSTPLQMVFCPRVVALPVPRRCIANIRDSHVYPTVFLGPRGYICITSMKMVSVCCIVTDHQDDGCAEALLNPMDRMVLSQILVVETACYGEHRMTPIPLPLLIQIKSIGILLVIRESHSPQESRSRGGGPSSNITTACQSLSCGLV